MGFMDMREWMNLLEKAGELRRVTAEVGWDSEIGDGAGEGGHQPGRCHRPGGVSSPEVALPRRRALHPYVFRHRDAGSGHARDERRHLSWNDRPKDTAPFLLIKGGQHWGAHFVKWA